MADNDIEDDDAPEDELYDVVYVPDMEQEQIEPPNPADRDVESEKLMTVHHPEAD
jgi:hypothetical protein